jgi:hypothetical protein
VEGAVTDLEWLGELARLMRSIVREEVSRAIANANRSRGPSATGIAAPGQGSDQCDEATNRGSMDRTSTEISGDSMSLQEAEEDGRRLIEDIQRGTSPKPRSQAHNRKRKAAR